MRENGLRGVRQGRFVPHTTDSAPRRAIAPHVLKRRFCVETAVPARTSDITDLVPREGGLSLAVIIALQTRQVLGYSLSDRRPDELVLNALAMLAIRKRRLAGHCFTPIVAVRTSAMMFARPSTPSAG